MNSHPTPESAIAEIATDRAARGYSVSGEHNAVCTAAVQFLGLPYHQGEELELATGIDCSTLVSQSYWEGAILRVPFTAEGQRLAPHAAIVDDVAHLQPADVLVRYASREASSDGRGNHVGLFLGWDQNGDGWLIESRGGVGVKLTELSDFPIEGGIRRFIAEQRTESGEAVSAARRIAALVPKLGRLGAKQYTLDQVQRIPHRGLDAYVASGTPVRASVAGRLRSYMDEVEGHSGVEIESPNMTIRLAPTVPEPGMIGADVRAGELIGIVGVQSAASRIRYASAAVWGDTHLHIEAECHSQPGTPVGETVQIDGRLFMNHLYASKVGLVGLPFDA